MSQAIRGVFGSVDGLATQVAEARRVRGLSWQRLAEGSPWTRQYLQFVLSSQIIPLEVIEYLATKLNIRLRISVAPSVESLLQP